MQINSITRAKVNITSTSLKGLIVSYLGLLCLGIGIGLILSRKNLLERFGNTPNVSDTWRADEIYIKVKGDMKYLFAMMDDETRFWIAQEVAESKDKHDTRKLLQMSKQLTGKKPKTFIHYLYSIFQWAH
jgi:hypothetical protein